MSVLEALAGKLSSGAVRMVDLTHTLDPDFPVIILPPEFGQCARFRMEEISAYDHRGPAWKWHNLTLSEHTGTHFDAPSHWISGYLERSWACAISYALPPCTVLQHYRSRTAGSSWMGLGNA